MNKAVFLDRDGVINEVKTDRVRFVNRSDHFYFLEGVLDATKILSEAGFLLFVVTNQGGVGLGYLSHDELDSIHHYMLDEIKKAGGSIQEVSSCTHKPLSGCACRKPEAGMILELTEKYDIDLRQSYMIGDREADIEAGRKAGCSTILVSDSLSPSFGADYIFPDLLNAAEFIVESE